MRRPALLVPVLFAALILATAIANRVYHGHPTVDRRGDSGPLNDSHGLRRSSTVANAGARDETGAIAPVPGRARDLAALRGRVLIREVSPGSYEVSGAAVQALLDQAGGFRRDLSLTITPLPSLDTGVQYWITSAAGDGVLTDQGFTVTDPKLAEAAGIEPGDTILRINGYPAGGFYLTLLSMRRDPDHRTVEVELDRRGARLIQTYRLR